MTPDEKRMLREIYAWMQLKKRQQITLPVDAASKAALGALIGGSIGTSDLTDTITIGAGGGSADVPKAYAGTFWIIDGGTQKEVPFLSQT